MFYLFLVQYLLYLFICKRDLNRTRSHHPPSRILPRTPSECPSTSHNHGTMSYTAGNNGTNATFAEHTTDPTLHWDRAYTSPGALYANKPFLLEAKLEPTQI